MEEKQMIKFQKFSNLSELLGCVDNWGVVRSFINGWRQR